LLKRIKTIDNKIYIGHSNGLLQIFDSNGNELKKWFAHNSGITDIILNNSNNTLITSSFDKTIKIWNLSHLTSQPVTLNIHNSWVYSISLSNDKKTLISGDASGKVKFTTIDIETLKKLVKQKVSKNMTEQDWKKYIGEGIDYNPNLPDDL
jgi:WD40 repeat protein